MDPDTIDLMLVHRAISTLINKEDQVYQPRTFNAHNRARSIYLPMYPTIAFGPNNHLLLPHVPVTRLAPHEIARRQQGAYTADAMTLLKNYHYSDRDGFSLSEQDAEELAARFQVGLSIITFNADQLRGFSHYLLALHESYRRKVLERSNVASRESILNSKQMAIALEFFLQMDVDVFYMRSCSFRRATESESNRSEAATASSGLFCENDEPQGRYTMVACGNLFCSCCYPISGGQTNQLRSSVEFESSAMHQFVNGYTTYLNCPATCHTTNIIYVMTCPCGHYDYVDSTAETLAPAMTYHRGHGNRVIHEKLTGSSLLPGMTDGPMESEKVVADKMRLYQHSARCPVALRLFLEYNPNYWCFIPLRSDDAQVENVPDVQGNSSLSSSAADSNVVTINMIDIIAMGTIRSSRLARCLGHVPSTPTGYAFSNKQRQKQRVFLEGFLSSSADLLPYLSVDLYKVATIAVLPNDCSIILRFIIETLFIIHGETKLNMICPIGGDPERPYGQPYDRVWCDNLNCPFVATEVSTHS